MLRGFLRRWRSEFYSTSLLPSLISGFVVCFNAKVPDDKKVQHKIQSSDGGLSLTLAKVPKILKPLVREWTPRGFVVSFKLETDEALLKGKALRSLETYGHQIVIGNILSTRYVEWGLMCVGRGEL
jgi:phosphopantothenoylcysteine synthetase/decarboxylase